MNSNNNNSNVINVALANAAVLAQMKQQQQTQATIPPPPYATINQLQNQIQNSIANVKLANNNNNNNNTTIRQGEESDDDNIDDILKDDTANVNETEITAPTIHQEEVKEVPAELVIQNRLQKKEKLKGIDTKSGRRNQFYSDDESNNSASSDDDDDSETNTTKRNKQTKPNYDGDGPEGKVNNLDKEELEQRERRRQLIALNLKELGAESKELEAALLNLEPLGEFKEVDTSAIGFFRRVNRIFLITGIICATNLALLVTCLNNYIKGKTQYSTDAEEAASSIGLLGVIDLFFAVTMMSHNNFIQRLWGRSFQQNAEYHAVVSYSGIFCIVLHGMLEMISGWIEFHFNDWEGIMLTTGLMSWICTVLIGLFSAKIFRLDKYPMFTFLHALFYIMIVVFGSIHSWACRILMAISILLWFTEYCWFRARRIRKTPKITDFSLLPGEIIRIKMAIEDFEYKAGQFVYVAIPGLQSKSSLEFHPFSISSSPYQKNNILLHVRAVGDWTDALQENAEDYLQVKLKKSKKKTAKELLPKIRVDGPFGMLTLPKPKLTSYEFVLFISGGIGVTPMQSLFNDYLHSICSHKKYEKVKRVQFVWACREQSTICDDYAGQGTIDQIKYLHFQPNLLDKRLVEQLRNNNPYNQSNCDIDFYLTRTAKLQSKRYLKKASKVLNPQFPVRPEYIRIRTPNDNGMNVFNIIRKMFKQACVSGVDRMAVLCCGPETLSKDVKEARDACKSLYVDIDLHVENFVI